MFHLRKKLQELNPKCACVVAAAGSSTRMGQDKLLLPLGGVPVILRTLQALNESPYIDHIIVVTRQETLVEIGTLCRDGGVDKVSAVLLGGETRLESVYKGVSQVSKKARLIAVHDGARPLVSQEVIGAAVRRAAICGAAVPAVEVKDTVKQVSGSEVISTPDRSALRAVQTPQVFDADLLRAALHKAVAEGWEVTDESAAVERLGKAVALTSGSEKNLKITTPLDIAVAEVVLAQEAT